MPAGPGDPFRPGSSRPFSSTLPGRARRIRPRQEISMARRQEPPRKEAPPPQGGAAGSEPSAGEQVASGSVGVPGERSFFLDVCRPAGTRQTDRTRDCRGSSWPPRLCLPVSSRGATRCRRRPWACLCPSGLQSCQRATQQPREAKGDPGRSRGRHVDVDPVHVHVDHHNCVQRESGRLRSDLAVCGSGPSRFAID